MIEDSSPKPSSLTDCCYPASAASSHREGSLISHLVVNVHRKVKANLLGRVDLKKKKLHCVSMLSCDGKGRSSRETGTIITRQVGSNYATEEFDGELVVHWGGRQLAYLTLQSRFIKGKLAGLPFGNRFLLIFQGYQELHSPQVLCQVHSGSPWSVTQSPKSASADANPLLKRQFIFSLIFEHRIRSVINGIRREAAGNSVALVVQIYTVLKQQSSLHVRTLACVCSGKPCIKCDCKVPHFTIAQPPEL